jgi:hypothetical protein
MKICRTLIITILFCLIINQHLNVESFNKNEIIEEKYLYSLPSSVSSPENIKQYLSEKGSFLANYMVPISIEPDDVILSLTNSNPELQPKNVLKDWLNKSIPFPELIWRITQTNMINGCSVSDDRICINVSQKKINPLFILGKIQKESGLIYGKNATRNPSDSDVQFLLDRLTGYICTEGSSTKSCFDDNPNWKYYKGVFKQIYFSLRFIQITQQRCNVTPEQSIKVYNQSFYTGANVLINGIDVKLQNSITCALYIYTPHVTSQKLLNDILESIGFYKEYNVDNLFDNSVENVTSKSTSIKADVQSLDQLNPKQELIVEKPKEISFEEKILKAENRFTDKSVEFENSTSEQVISSIIYKSMFYKF